MTSAGRAAFYTWYQQQGKIFYLQEEWLYRQVPAFGHKISLNQIRQ